MAFSDFKAIPEVQEKFQIRYMESDFIKTEDNAIPSEQFVQEIEFNREFIDAFPLKGLVVRQLFSLFCAKSTRVMLIIMLSG